MSSLDRSRLKRAWDVSPVGLPAIHAYYASSFCATLNVRAPRPVSPRKGTRCGARSLDPDLEQACSGDITVLLAYIVSFAHARREFLVVVSQFSQHVQRFDVFPIVIGHPLKASNVTNRPQRRTADFTDAFRNGIGHRVDVIGLFIQQQMVVAEVRPAHVPMEVFVFR